MEPVVDGVLSKYKQPDGTFSKSFVDMQDEARKAGEEIYKGDPGAGTAAAQSFDRKYNQLNWAKLQDDRGTQQQLYNYMTKGVQSVDLLPADLRAKMTPQQLKEFPARANTYQQSVNTQTDKVAYDKLLGLYNNDNGSFMDLDIMKMPGLSKSNRDYFMKLQRQENANGDPRVSRAMTQLRGSDGTVLEALGVHGRTKDNKEDYDQFTGALHSAIQSYQEINGKPPNEQALSKEILPSLIREITEPGLFNIGGYGTTNKIPFFKSTIPEEIRTQANTEAGKDLSDADVRKWYNRQIFDTLYARQKAAKPKAQDRVQ